jgi:hypothetical protein
MDVAGKEQRHPRDRLSRWRSGCIVLLTAFVLACKDAAAPEESGLRILQPLNADTALSPVVQTLVLQVIRRGSPAPGSIVHLQTFTSETKARVVFHARDRAVTELQDTTDQNGQLSVRVMIAGQSAGEVLIYARVPSLNTVDTISVAVLPGNPVAVYPNIAAFHLQIDSAMTLQAETIDRNSNRRPAQLICAPRSDVVLVEPTCVVRGVAPGTATLTARTPEGLPYAPTIRVVPHGTFAVGMVSAIKIHDLDGTDVHMFPVASFNAYDLEWAPDGNRIFFTNGSEPRPGLRILDLVSGSVSDLLGLSAPGIAQLAPQVTKDGAWIYFVARTAATPLTSEIWRVRSDGSAPQRVGPPAVTGRFDDRPSPSPDGTRAAYSTGTSAGERSIRILVLATGGEQTLERGEYPRWSPSGDQIAFVNGPQVRIRGLATSVSRLVATLTAPKALDWSPDGRYLVISESYTPAGLGQRTTGGVYLVDVQTNTVVILPHTPYAPGSTSDPGVALSAAWRP